MKDSYHTERFATRMVKGRHHLEHIQRLQRVYLYSLEKRRQRADLILAKSQSQSQNILVINAQMALNHVKQNCKQLLRFIQTEYGFPTGI